MTAVDVFITDAVAVDVLVTEITIVEVLIGTPGLPGATGPVGPQGIGITNLDGGAPTSNYGGITPIDSGGVTQ